MVHEFAVDRRAAITAGADPADLRRPRLLTVARRGGDVRAPAERATRSAPRDHARRRYTAAQRSVRVDHAVPRTHAISGYSTPESACSRPGQLRIVTGLRCALRMAPTWASAWSAGEGDVGHACGFGSRIDRAEHRDHAGKQLVAGQACRPVTVSAAAAKAGSPIAACPRWQASTSFTWCGSRLRTAATAR